MHAGQIGLLQQLVTKTSELFNPLAELELSVRRGGSEDEQARQSVAPVRRG